MDPLNQETFSSELLPYIFFNNCSPSGFFFFLSPPSPFKEFLLIVNTVYFSNFLLFLPYIIFYICIILSESYPQSVSNSYSNFLFCHFNFQEPFFVVF